jgi:hypothetical protein
MQDLIEAARPSFNATARRIELTMGGFRGFSGLELQDAVISEGEPLRIADFIVGNGTGKRSFAWCMETECPEEIVPISVDLSEKGASIPATGKQKGLYRLKVVGRVSEQRFYTPGEAWVLITAPEEVVRIKAGIDALHKQLQAGNSGEEEVRLAVRMYLAAQRPH